MEKSLTQLASRNFASRIMQSISSRANERSQTVAGSESTGQDLGQGEPVAVKSSRRILSEKEKQRILEGKMKTDFESVVTPEEKAAKKAEKKKGKGKKGKAKVKETVSEVQVEKDVCEAETEEVKVEKKKEGAKKAKKEKGKATEKKEGEDKKGKKDGNKSKKKDVVLDNKELKSIQNLKSREQFQSKPQFVSTDKLTSKVNVKSVERLHSRVEFKDIDEKSTEVVKTAMTQSRGDLKGLLKSKESISTTDHSSSIDEDPRSSIGRSKVSFAALKKGDKKTKKGAKKGTRKSLTKSKSTLQNDTEEGERGTETGTSRVKLPRKKSHLTKKKFVSRSESTASKFRDESMYDISRAASSFFDDSSSSSTSQEVSTKKTRKKGGKKDLEKKKKGKKKDEDEKESEGKKKAKKKGEKKEKEKDESVATKSVVTSTAESTVDESEKVKKGKKKGKGKGKKKGKKKELTPKERARLEEEKRLQAEADAIREAEEERQRQIEEKKMGIAKAKRETLEQQWRVEQLESSMEFIESVVEAGRQAYAADKVVEDWEEYLCCDGLPKPWNTAEMNTYLHLWDKEIKTVTIEQAVRRTDEIVKLLDDLETLICDPFDHSLSRQADWKWIRSQFREHQSDNLNFATYRLLRYISNRMNRIDIPTADYRLAEKNFSLCLWTLIKLPTPTPNPRIPGRPRLQVEWPEMKVEILFPNSLHCDNLAVRGMYVKYDHMSDTCASYNAPDDSDFYCKELGDLTAREWFLKMRYKYDHRVIVKKEPEEVVLEDGTVAYVEPEDEPELPPDEMPPAVPFQLLEPSASTVALNLEKEEFDKKCTQITVPDKVLNMRRFQVIGGIYHLDLFVQPPQPQEMVSFEVFVSTLMIPCNLAEAQFYVSYTPPPPPEPGVRKEPEEIEEEMIKMERELDELIFVNLILPEHVFWLEAPVVCQWDKVLNAWTTADVHDLKYFEDKGYLTFRTGKFGPFALALYRYSNLPFQAWEIRPESDGSVTFQLTAAILLVEFNVKGYLVCISQIQNEPNDAMQAHIGVYHKLPKLITILRSFGVDIFPSNDTFFYVEGTCEKHWPMEKQTYYGMAYGSTAYNFSWSRWNMTLDYRNIAFQMRIFKFNKPKQLSFSMCLVTPLKAVLVDCTEVSPTFNQESVEGSKFYADFLFLMKGASNMATKNKLQAAPLETVNTLANLFQATRFLSFS